MLLKIIKYIFHIYIWQNHVLIVVINNLVDAYYTFIPTFNFKSFIYNFSLKK